MRVKLIPRPPCRGADVPNPSTMAPVTPEAPCRLFRCPACGREFLWQDTPHRPFCTLACRLIDLGVWLDEGYRIPAIKEPPPEAPPGER